MKTIIIIASLLTACGSEPSKTAANLAADTPTPSTDSQGPQGPQGPAGPMGPQGPKGDTGAAGSVGIGTTGATGAAGAAGAVGATGGQGIAGQTGATGAPGSIDVLNAADVKVGILVDAVSDIIMFPDGGLLITQVDGGGYFGSLSYLDQTNVGATCGFTSNNCTGPCYMVAIPNGSSAAMNYPLPNAVIWDGTTLWRYAGEPEAPADAEPFESFMQPNGTTNGCKAQQFTTNNAGAYGPMAHAETLPTGAAFPFGNLHFAPEAAQ